MWNFIASVAVQCATILKDALLVLWLPALLFIAFAIIAKGLVPAWTAAKRAIRETRFNLAIYILDSLTVGPFFILQYALMSDVADAAGLRLIGPDFWSVLPAPLVGFAAVFAGDFAGYWRHRLEHTRFLWPSHAVHHSDTAMTWLALLRFHPFNRISTFVIDNAFLLLLGFPAYALLVSSLVRHHYGFFIHADLPWSYGRLGRIFVSPVMHRWHHSIETEAHETNFATVFSIFDRIFGTYWAPGFPATRLGATSHMEMGVWAQLLYPFRLSAYAAAPDASRNSGSPEETASELAIARQWGMTESQLTAVSENIVLAKGTSTIHP
jgi:sterol desaturase/sphingolipid hydroxylase (fatty acid hydroxylase superfamily)